MTRKVDAVTVPVPDLDAGLVLYMRALGRRLRWRNEELGQPRPRAARERREIVLWTTLGYEPHWLVESADAAAKRVREAAGTVLHEPPHIPVARQPSSPTVLLDPV